MTEVAEADDVNPEVDVDATPTSEPACRPSPSPRTRMDEGDGDALADEPAGQHGEADGNSEERSRSRIYGWLVVALAVVCIALAVVGTLVGLALWRGHDQDRDRTAATEAARTEVTNILTIDPKAIDAGVRRIIDGATGAFKKDFVSRKDVFTAVVRKQKVVSTGKIRSIGVESSSEGQASILAAATSTVTNAKAGGQKQPRDYRIRVQMRKEDGRWLASQVEFVS